MRLPILFSDKTFLLVTLCCGISLLASGCGDGRGGELLPEERLGDTTRQERSSRSSAQACASQPSECGSSAELAGAGCGQILLARPKAVDGVYWIEGPSGPIRAYCDMQQGVDLCTEIEGEHVGRTREASRMGYRMRSILLPGKNTCELWNVRALSDNKPLDQLYAVGGNTLGTCQALGFKQSDQLGRCAFGVSHTSCGFAVSGPNDYFRHGNACTGCTLNEGLFPGYVLQGSMSNASVISDVSGIVRTRCLVEFNGCELNPNGCGSAPSQAAAGCGQIHRLRPSAPSGVYWLASQDHTPRQAYCDMRHGLELCNEVEGDHLGVAPQANGLFLSYKLRSILRPSSGTCELWAIRSYKEGAPFDRLIKTHGNTPSTCQALGFKSDLALGTCVYGKSYGNCGFASAAYFRYGNSCSGCSINNGQFASYLLQGPMSNSSVLSTMNGTVRSICTVQ